MDISLVLFQAGIFILLLTVGYAIGYYLESRHLADIKRRIDKNSDMGVTSQKKISSNVGSFAAIGLVCGSAVISADYFKIIIASFMNLVGGEIDILSKLANRARQEALLRMLNDARELGANAVINVRFEISTINEPNGSQSGIVEAIAYGTAVKINEKC